MKLIFKITYDKINLNALFYMKTVGKAILITMFVWPKHLYKQSSFSVIHPWTVFTVNFLIDRFFYD